MHSEAAGGRFEVEYPLLFCDLNLLNGRTKEGGQSQKKKVEKLQDGRQKSGQNIGNPYQMEDNKNPKGVARSAAPLGRHRRRRRVVFHLGRISDVLA